MGKGEKTTMEAARRIQSSVDKTGSDPGFKSRAMSAATKHENKK